MRGGIHSWGFSIGSLDASGDRRPNPTTGPTGTAIADAMFDASDSEEGEGGDSGDNVESVGYDGGSEVGDFGGGDF